VDTWVIVLIIVAVVVVLALLALMMSKRSGAAQARKREQAREHLQEAQVRGARADREQALAEEQAARARREKAEAEERAAVAEREARERVAQAHDERSTADQLRAKADKLAPGLSDGQATRHPVDPSVRRDEPGGGGATRR
jgi:FtsZ-interacting cell division protein ZipA